LLLILEIIQLRQIHYVSKIHRFCSVREDGAYKHCNNGSHHLEQGLSNWRDLAADGVENDVSNIRTSINDQCNIKMHQTVKIHFSGGEKKFRFFF
jgi:hypothetical protein